MPDALPPLAWLRSFEAAARTGGFAAAARELHLTPAAVSQQIRSLEHELGFELFDRLPRGIKLTEMGSAYLPAVRQALEDLARATAGLFGNRDRRMLTIRAEMSFLTLRLVREVRAFRLKHPHFEIRLLGSIWSDAIEPKRIDAEIRYGVGHWEGYDAYRLFDCRSLPVCAPGVRFSSDPAAALETLTRLTPIHIIGCDALWPRFEAQHGAAPRGPGVYVDASMAALELAAAGAGVALIAPELAEEMLAAGRVVTPTALELTHDQSHHLLIRRDGRAPSADILLLKDWILEAFKTETGAPTAS